MTLTKAQRREVNRRNAAKSTGPRTAGGLAAIRHNNLRHGALSQSDLLPGEDPAEFMATCQKMAEDLHPVGKAEEALASAVARGLWRRRRGEAAEEVAFALLASKLGEALGEGTDAGLRGDLAGPTMELLGRYLARGDVRLRRDLEELERLQAARREREDLEVKARTAEVMDDIFGTMMADLEDEKLGFECSAALPEVKEEKA